MMFFKNKTQILLKYYENELKNTILDLDSLKN